MILQSVIDAIHNTQSGGIWSVLGLFSDIFTDATPCTREFDSTCPSSAFNVITAAFATQGYWIQADILDYFNGGMGTLAILIYVLSAVAGIFSMSMGAPPKMYGWFFMGPYIFYWLTQTTTSDTSVDGVRVMMGKPGGSFFNQGAASSQQQRVWRYAQVGLEGMRIFERKQCSLDEQEGPTCSLKDEDEVGDGAVNPAYFFVKFDALVSDIVENMVDWTGVYYINSGDGSGDELSQGRNGSISPDHLVSTMKWGLLEDITSAKLASPDVRDMFVNFLSSECGDGFAQAISPQAFAAANSARKGFMPAHIFYDGVPDTGQFETLRQLLQDEAIPKPRSVNKLLSLSSEKISGSFLNSLSGGSNGGAAGTAASQISSSFGGDTIHCLDLLQLVNLSFRWQATQLFYQMLTTTPPGMEPQRMLKNFLYGWPISKELIDDGGALGSDSKLQEFFINLIMVHMYRNEFAIAPQPVTKVSSGSQANVEYSETYQRTVGQKTKFSELYTWALLTPYLQGVLLYFLAMSYPFVCMLMIIPGWHKILGTWCSFWIWVKLWDLGFAVVTVLERSVWSIIGNDYDATEHLRKVAEIGDKWGTHSIKCSGQAASGSVLKQLCPASLPIPDIKLNLTAPFNTLNEFVNSMYITDRMMTVGASLQLDLANSYYIYVMAALYFAVPAVLGQVVLGAKAGAAGLATNAFSQVASEVGRSSGSGYTGDLGKRAEQAAAQAKQTFTAKAMRTGAASSNVASALQLGNKALNKELDAGYYGEHAHGIARDSRIQSLAIKEQQDALGTGTELQQSMVQMAQSTISVEARGVSAVKGGFGAFAEANKSGVLPSGGRGGGQVLPTGGLTSNPEASKKAAAAANLTGVVDQSLMAGSDILGQQSTLLGAKSKYANFGLSQIERQYQASAEAEQSQATILGWAQGNYGKGFGDAARTQGEMSEQVASDEVADSMARVAFQTAGSLGAQGVNNPYSISRNASMKAMAGLGMLGSSNKRQALYTQEGNAFYGKIDARRSELLSSFGSEKLNSKFQLMDFNNALGRRDTTWSNATKDSNSTQGQIQDKLIDPRVLPQVAKYAPVMAQDTPVASIVNHNDFVAQPAGGSSLITAPISPPE